MHTNSTWAEITPDGIRVLRIPNLLADHPLNSFWVPARYPNWATSMIAAISSDAPMGYTRLLFRSYSEDRIGIRDFDPIMDNAGNYMVLSQKEALETADILKHLAASMPRVHETRRRFFPIATPEHQEYLGIRERFSPREILYRYFLYNNDPDYPELQNYYQIVCLSVEERRSLSIVTFHVPIEALPRTSSGIYNIPQSGVFLTHDGVFELHDLLMEMIAEMGYPRIEGLSALSNDTWIETPEFVSNMYHLGRFRVNERNRFWGHAKEMQRVQAARSELPKPPLSFIEQLLVDERNPLWRYFKEAVRVQAARERRQRDVPPPPIIVVRDHVAPPDYVHIFFKTLLQPLLPYESDLNYKLSNDPTANYLLLPKIEVLNTVQILEGIAHAMPERAETPSRFSRISDPKHLAALSLNLFPQQTETQYFLYESDSTVPFLQSYHQLLSLTIISSTHLQISAWHVPVEIIDPTRPRYSGELAGLYLTRDGILELCSMLRQAATKIR